MEENGKTPDWRSRVENLRSNSQKPGMISEKICPFMSSADKQVACTPQCKLYRAGKKDYECYFQELQAVSWFLNPRRKY